MNGSEIKSRRVQVKDREGTVTTIDAQEVVVDAGNGEVLTLLFWGRDGAVQTFAGRWPVRLEEIEEIGRISNLIVLPGGSNMITLEVKSAPVRPRTPES